MRLTVFHIVQLCFAAEAQVTGSLWAVDGNNIGPFFSSRHCFLNFMFESRHVARAGVSGSVWVVGGSNMPPPPSPTTPPPHPTPRTICFSHCDVFCQESQESILQMEASVGGAMSQFKKLLFGTSTSSFVFQIMSLF